jgi:nucleotide sugar dehydrogenase
VEVLVNVCVVALGKIGLPLSVQFARAGHQVIGADIDARAVEMINSGIPPFPGETHLDKYLPEVIASGSFRATTDTANAVSTSSVVVVVVPLLVDSSAQPDYRAMDAATADVAQGLKAGTLVSYETTIPVHTTRKRFAPLLAEISGLTCGEDFFVCHSPERVFSGRIFSDLRAYPKLVGGLDVESTRRAVEFYESALDFDDRPDLPKSNGVWDLGSAEAAELAKLAETTYRDVNIGLANQFARFADSIGVDVTAVIEACNTQPYSHIHRPGVAVGGHCIPVYPRFYLVNDPSASIVQAAREANLGMPAYAVDLLQAAVGSLPGRDVLVLGAAYRGGVQETAFSGVFDLVAELESRGARAVVHDPLYTADELNTLGLVAYATGTDTPCGAIVQADHQEYRSLSPELLGDASVVVDGRNWVNELPSNVRRITIGRGKRVGSDVHAAGSVGSIA